MKTFSFYGHEDASELQNEVKIPIEKLTSNQKGYDSEIDEGKKKHFPSHAVK